MWEFSLGVYLTFKGFKPCRITAEIEAAQMIEVENLSKRYGNKLAVDGLNFVVQPGIVTGFLGPNGSGKSTTMRMIAGLDRPTAGRVVVNGGDYRSRRADGRTRGAARGQGRPHRSIRPQPPAGAGPDQRHQRAAGGRGDRHRRPPEVAGKRVGGFSLGMGQRLGVASALLGNPRTVVLDEPVNGLDPEGVRWMRTMLKDLAADGHTVFVSSHLMSEMAQTATRLVVIGRGRLIADTTVDEFVARASHHSVTVRTPEAARLRELLVGPDITVTTDIGQPDVLGVDGLTAEHIGTIAWQHQVPDLRTDRPTGIPGRSIHDPDQRLRRIPLHRYRHREARGDAMTDILHARLGNHSRADAAAGHRTAGGAVRVDQVPLAAVHRLHAC